MTLKELNVEAEKMKSYGRPYNAEYRARYARCVLDLDSMNKQMAMYLEGIQTYCLEVSTISLLNLYPVFKSLSVVFLPQY